MNMKWYTPALVLLVVTGVLLHVVFRYERIVTQQGMFRLDRLTGNVSRASSIDDPSVVEQFKAKNASLRERLDLLADENDRLRVVAASAVSGRNAVDEQAAPFEQNCP